MCGLLMPVVLICFRDVCCPVFPGGKSISQGSRKSSKILFQGGEHVCDRSHPLFVTSRPPETAMSRITAKQGGRARRTGPCVMAHFLPSARPDGKRGLAENATLCLRRQRQCPERIERFLDAVHAWAGPVAAVKRLVCDLRQAREVLEQLCRRNAADVQVNIGMAAHQEEGSVHPQRPASMGEHNLQFRKIDRYIVYVNRVPVLVACAG